MSTVLGGRMFKLKDQLENQFPPNISHEERTIFGPDNNELIISIFRKKSSRGLLDQKGHPGVYHIRGGGLIAGNRFTGITWPLKVVEELDAICISIEYRLAPAHPDPAPIENCYSGLTWIVKHAAELGVDTRHILIHRASAGGGLSAGVTLLCRDRNGPTLIGQILFAPMLDDRNGTMSAHQFEGKGIWDRRDNLRGWSALSGEGRGSENVSIYAAPAREIDLSGLPPAFIDVGSCETFRDEVIQYAQKRWQHGVQCELHVWPGGFHGFEALLPERFSISCSYKAKA
ncbi:Alpha/Beta hydrolase protein [Aspergillus cavernicola]|uniref:Alpha/Beta hydrolase protein n=1 Tax=Aspergillus cavernicola TaxID=176166 RepID=A0ABR4HWG5_9EURO